MVATRPISTAMPEAKPLFCAYLQGNCTGRTAIQAKDTGPLLPQEQLGSELFFELVSLSFCCFNGLNFRCTDALQPVSSTRDLYSITFSRKKIRKLLQPFPHLLAPKTQANIRPRIFKHLRG